MLNIWEVFTIFPDVRFNLLIKPETCSITSLHSTTVTYCKDIKFTFSDILLSLWRVHYCNSLHDGPQRWAYAYTCKGYSHFGKKHVVGVIGGGESLQVSLQLQQLPLHLPEALFQILCRHWHTPTYFQTRIHTLIKAHVRTTQLKVQSNALLFSSTGRIRKTTHNNKTTGKMKEKPAQSQSRLIMGSHCAQNTVGINNDKI